VSRRRAALAVSAAVAALAIAWAIRVSRPTEPVLYRGGPIVTLDADDRVLGALAAEGGRIVAVGSEAELAGWARRRGTRVVDLHGRALLPGFIDAHGHFLFAGLAASRVDLSSPPVGSVRDLDELVGRLAARAGETAPGDWVVGFGYDDTLLAERRHPTRADLDRVSVEHPVVSVHVSGHLAAVNSAALSRLGIDRETHDPEGGRIRRDAATGEPDGVLEERALVPLKAEALRPGLGELPAIARRASELYLRAGVTTAQDGLASIGALRALGALSRLGQIPVRLVVWPDEAAAEALLAGGRALRLADPERVRIGAVKLTADGSIQGYTAYLSAPYFVPPGAEAAYRGWPQMEREELARRVARFHAAGLQVAVHANGDAAIDDVLAAFEAAQREHPRADARPVLVHVQTARPDQLDRMRALGVVPSFFGLHVFYWGDRHREIFLGPERAARISAARSAAARGLRFTLHCDTPVVPIDPLRAVATAVSRRTASGAVLGPDERIGVERALRAVTSDAAFQLFQEMEKGSLEPGKLADLVVLDRSPLDDPEHVGEIRVLETIVGGRVAWRAPDSTP
jgi:hypothetical protein